MVSDDTIADFLTKLLNGPDIQKDNNRIHPVDIEKELEILVSIFKSNRSEK